MIPKKNNAAQQEMLDIVWSGPTRCFHPVDVTNFKVCRTYFMRIDRINTENRCPVHCHVWSKAECHQRP